MRKNSMKNLRVNEEDQHELSSIIRELKDPRIAMMTTVTEVNVATDLKTCKAYISVLGDEQSKKDTMEGLRSAAGFIRRELAHSLNMRNTPEITFKLDTSIERGVEMSHLIDEVMQKDRQSEIRSEEDDYADEN